MIDLRTVGNIYDIISIFFLAYLIGYASFLFISTTVGSTKLYEQKKRQKMYNYIEHNFYIPISVIVPAHNERTTIVDTVWSLLNVDYRMHEIVVVDDGSTDGMSQKLIEHFKMLPLDRPIRKRIPCQPEEFVYCTYSYKVPITLIRKVNGGKADALNMGINASEYPYFICMDADSVLQHDALINIARPVLEQPDVIAVGGLVRIVNDVTLEKGHVIDYKMPKNLLLCMQILEYDRSFLASRLFFDQFNGNLIISGAFGLFRKDLVMAIGGYNSETMGEDMELVVRLHAFCRQNQIPYHIKYASNAVCWSQAPFTLKDLKKQRRRWHIGLFQSIFEHRQLLFRPQYGMLSFVSFLYFLVYELLSPYIEIIGLLTTIVAARFHLVNIPFMIMFFLLYALLNASMSLTAFFSRVHAMDIKLSGHDICKALFLCLIENIGLRFILAATRFTAFIGYKRRKRDWGDIERFKMKKKGETSHEKAD